MGSTTFSGPIRAGNIRNTTGTTVGTNIANVGFVVMCQQHVMDISGGAVAAEATTIVIPANSKIVDIIVDLEVADEELIRISNDGLLALNLEEMQAIQAYYRDPQTQESRVESGLHPNAPTDVELECLAQTWSEHCKHKIFAA